MLTLLFKKYNENMNTTQVVTRDKFFLTKFNFPLSSSSDNRLTDDGNNSDDGSVKNRLLYMWNNMKYGLKLKTNFSKESPVWLLGKCYRRIESSSTEIPEFGTDVAAFQSQSELTNGDDEGFEGFKKDFISKLWMTYRREFPVLSGSNYSSDCGWGCMIRSGQMLIAQALVCHILGRDWRWDPDEQPVNRESYIELVNHRKIIKWFGDKPSRNSPLSLHTLVNLGEESGKKAGDWYGPGFVAHLFRKAIKIAAQDNYEFDSLNVYVAQDCTIYIKDVMAECLDENNVWKSLILLIPVRLGAEKFNPAYASSLTALFSIKQCIGIIGGRPKHSLYFVGYQDDKLIHLDPHYCQDSVDVWSRDFLLTSFHCLSPRKMHLNKLDPSCCIGFYCNKKEDFFNLIEIVQPLMIQSSQSDGGGECGSNVYPMFTFCDGYSRDVNKSPKKLPLPELEYFDNLVTDDIETEAFEFVGVI